MYNSKGKKKISAEDLSHKIEIGIIQNMQDNDGFNVETFVKNFSPWASIRNISGTEVFKSGADYNRKITRFLIRYRKDKNVNKDMKVKYKGKLYNITYINNYNEGNEFVEFITEVVR
ncbi:MAG: phage head closure protein [Clostridia bacterium]|nr:phage head closure protein [Clostridia bacterium]